MNSNRINKYKYPGAKRLMLEAQELKDKTEDYCAQPIDDNLFEWHFTVRGPPDTAFEGGYYHGRLSFPTEYPMKPPSIILLTPNGRFSINKKICLSISGYHPETWQPSWSVRTALLALIAFMPTKSNRAIGSLDFSDAERRKLAEKSRTWRCETCGLIRDLLKHPGDTSNQDIHEQAGTSRDVSEESILNDNVKCKIDVSRRESRQISSERDNSEDSQSPSSKTNEIKCDESRKDSSNSNTRPTARLEAKTNDEPADDCLRQSEAPQPGTSSRSFKIDNQVQSPTNGSSENVASIVTESETTQDNRRTYPTLVYASIFILLFLLVLRRIVMVIQS